MIKHVARSRCGSSGSPTAGSAAPVAGRRRLAEAGADAAAGARRPQVGPAVRDPAALPARTAGTSWSSPRRAGCRTTRSGTPTSRSTPRPPSASRASGAAGAGPHRRRPTSARAVAAAGRAVRRLREVPEVDRPRDPGRGPRAPLNHRILAPFDVVHDNRAPAGPHDHPPRPWSPRQMDDGEGRPVITGLLALVGVAVAVGLILGVVARSAPSSWAWTAGQQLAGRRRAVDDLPKPSRHQQPSGPLITLAPGETQPASPSSAPPKKPTRSKSPKTQISLRPADPRSARCSRST